LPASSMRFVYAKATQGESGQDPTFKKNWSSLQQLSSNNFRRGAYHFLSANADPAKEAENFLKVIGKVDKNDLPPSLDVEWDLYTDLDGKKKDRWGKYSSVDIVNHVKTWLDIVEKRTGRRPIIYTCANWWNKRIGNNHELKPYRYWIADYTSKSLDRESPRTPEGSWLLWQFTDQSSAPRGILSGSVDASVFNGSPADISAAFAN